MKNRNLIDSFNNALNGIIYALKSEVNMKIHSIMACIVFVLSLFYDLTRTELLVLFFTVALVIVCELFNTAIEGIVDIVVDVYHPKAKHIKDVAAGAVLVSAANSVVVAYILFYERMDENAYHLFEKIRQSPVRLAFFAILFTAAAVLVIKYFSGKGTPFQGGMPSGHSALAFTIATAAAIWAQDIRVSVLCYVLAVLVMQSRIENGVHTLLEVMIGGLMGILITFLIFQLLV